MVLKLFGGKKFCENGQKSWKSRSLIQAKFNTFKVFFCDNNFMKKMPSKLSINLKITHKLI